MLSKLFELQYCMFYINIDVDTGGQEGARAPQLIETLNFFIRRIDRPRGVFVNKYLFSKYSNSE